VVQFLTRILGGSSLSSLPAKYALVQLQDEPTPKGKIGKGSPGSKGKGSSSPSPPAQVEPPAAIPEADSTTAAPKTGKSGKGSSGSQGKDGSSSSSGSSGLGSLFGGSNPLTNILSSTISEMKGEAYTCKSAALLFARGTGEPGNMGYVVGPPLAMALRKEAIGKDLLIQGVDYSTTFTGGGATEMVKLVKAGAAKCPNMKFILGGYSQGAMQVHQALGQLGELGAKVAVRCRQCFVWNE
jgi:cutinase